MNKLSLIALHIIAFCLCATVCSSQSLPVGSNDYEDYYRRQQIIGIGDSTVSLLLRPVSQKLFGTNIAKEDSLETPFFLKVLPLKLRQQINSDHPYGWNDGAMIPAKGYQAMFSAGVYLKYKFLSFQFQPEFIWAENKEYSGFLNTDFSNKGFVKEYIRYYVNNIDAPERYGQGAYSKLLAGQSNILANFGPIAAGLSTENMWWGPGKFNSLLLSNNAPGFGHITIHTSKPLHTSIGTIEGELFGGRLNHSGYYPLLNGLNSTEPYYLPKIDDWRYISGLLFIYQPKWIPRLYIGTAKSAIIYHQDMGKKLYSYLPINNLYVKSAEGYDKAIARKQDQYSTFFLRWVLPKDRAEVYFEYGFNDFHWNLRDMFIQPDHSRAYIIGLEKLFAMRKNNYIQTSIEITEMAASKTYRIRTSPSWYTHNQVRDGYTNLGQVIGAGIGPGGNLQSLSINWVNGLKKIGLLVQRYEHNNDYFYAFFADPRIHWIDISKGFVSSWDYKKFTITSNLQLINSLNYQWNYIEAIPFGPVATLDEFWHPSKATKNIHLDISLDFKF